VQPSPSPTNLGLGFTTQA